MPTKAQTDFAFHQLGQVLRDLEADLRWKLDGSVRIPAEWHDIAQSSEQPLKSKITLRVDQDVARFFRAMGQGHLTRMNAVLRAFMLARLAEVVKAENEQARALMSANNQAVAFGANVRRDQASVDNMERDDKRAVAATAKAESDAKAKSAAAVALYRQRNPNATEVELEAVRRGVVSAVPTAKVESSFTPNPLGGGGTVTQRMPDGTTVITPVVGSMSKRSCPLPPTIS